jgi:hypothetical protein
MEEQGGSVHADAPQGFAAHLPQTSEHRLDPRPDSGDTSVAAVLAGGQGLVLGRLAPGGGP